MKQSVFSSLKLNPELIKNLSTLEYHEMTPIQAQSLPPILDGKDVIGQGKTGSGKTAAFSLGLLNKLDVKKFRVQSLVLCPTRELADQVAKEIRKLGRRIHNIKVLTLCGGMPFGPQIGSLEHGAHIIVGTPGRIEEHLRKGTLNLSDVEVFVLDEADRMLDMGFQPALDAIISFVPENRQTLLFSATFSKQIQTIANKITKQSVMIKVAETHDEQSIKQHLIKINENDRVIAIRLILLQQCAESAIIFCNTKRETQEVADALFSNGFSVLALHGDLDQKARDQTLVRFANKSVSVLVATDVAARGLDIDSIDAVINYQIANELEVHVHRIGRTGRAGSTGIAYTLFTDNESYRVAQLEEYLNQKIEIEAMPSVQILDQPIYQPEMATLHISGGRKQKVRPGDILGALTAGKNIDGKEVGKIHLFDNCAYVAVRRDVATIAFQKLDEGKLKGRSFRVRRIRG